MAIKTKLLNDKSVYLYAQCEIHTGKVIGLRWLPEDDRHGDCIGFKGAMNEQRLLKVDEVYPDDIESHPGWFNVNVDGDACSVSLNATKRDAWYLQELKAERDRLLEECDWEVIRHMDQINGGFETSLSSEEYTALLVYRQALRDWTVTEEDLYNRTTPVRG